MANDRKKRLHTLKGEQQQNNLAGSPGGLRETGPNESEKTEGEYLNTFIKDIVGKKKQRKKQLEIIHDFFINPASYGVDMELIPSSTKQLEIDDRKKDLQYRIDLLRSVLTAMEGEMQMLSQMKHINEHEEDEPVSEHASPVTKE
jgi:hypothetical protein